MPRTPVQWLSDTWEVNWVWICAASAAIGAVLYGGGLLAVASEPTSWWAHLVTDMGKGLILSVSVAMLSRLLQLKAIFAEVHVAVGLSKSLSEQGLVDCFYPFTEHAVLERMKRASNMTMFAMRGRGFFTQNYDFLRKWIGDGGTLTIVLVNPEGDHTAGIARKFTGLGDNDVASSIDHVLQHFIKAQIFEKLSANRRSALSVYLTDLHPPYSAYLFDDEELWYIPYHARKDKRPLPVYVFKRSRGSATGKHIFEDFDALIRVESPLAQPYELAAS